MLVIARSKQRRLLTGGVVTSILTFVLAIAAIGVPNWVVFSAYGVSAQFGLWIGCIPTYSGTSCGSCK